MEAEAGGEEDPGGGLGRTPKDGQGESRREQEIFPTRLAWLRAVSLVQYLL